MYGSNTFGGPYPGQVNSEGGSEPTVPESKAGGIGTSYPGQVYPGENYPPTNFPSASPSVSPSASLSPSISPSISPSSSISPSPAAGFPVNQPCTTTAPDAGTLKSDATWVNAGAGSSYLRLTTVSAFTNGALEFSDTLPTSFVVSFDIWAGGGTGADANWFYFGDLTTPIQEDGSNGGYHISFSEYSGNIAIYFNGASLATYNYGGMGDSTWRSVKI